MMNKISRAWDWNKNSQAMWYEPSEDSYYLVNRWREKGFSKFLDLGCGRGRHSIQFAKSGFDVSSLDLSDVAVDGLKVWAEKEDLNINAAIGDMTALPYDDNTFDCILAYHVISHTDSKGIIKIISEIRRVLKDGGEFYITLCSKNSWGFKDAGFPRIDENSVIRIEDGPENNVPHYYVDEAGLRKLLSGFSLYTVRHVQDVVFQGQDYVSWHYYVLGGK